MLRCAAMLLALFARPLAAQSVARSEGSGAPLGGRRGAIVLYDNLGAHHYPVNAGPAGQAWFDQGLRFFWASNFGAAAASFREGERRDPGCAMCAWGVALAVGSPPDRDVAAGLADTVVAALARARRVVTRPDERRLIDALAVRYTGTGPPADTAYAAAMNALVALKPADVEVRVLAMAAEMAVRRGNYWTRDGTPRPGTERILAGLTIALDAAPHHPGACHLLIHLLEGRDVTPAAGCAADLADRMPGAGHAAHMAARVALRLGRYADAVAYGDAALQADRTLFEGPAPDRRSAYRAAYYPMHHQVQAFAAAMMGASERAIDHAFRAQRAADASLAGPLPWVEAITPAGYQMLVTFGKWERILAEPMPRSGLRFTTGMAYYARGAAFAAKRRWAEARAALDSVSRIAGSEHEGTGRTGLLIAERALAGEIALRRGARNDAIREFRSAVALEDALPAPRPAVWYYPMRHSLGRALVQAGRLAEAEQVYREDLARYPENGWSLYGLAQALKGQRRLEEAQAMVDRFNQAWSGADVHLTASRF